MWSTFGYPGPISAPPQEDRSRSSRWSPRATSCSLEADVVVVGSGAGGGVIAGTLAEAGLKVVVLEAGGYFDESDFNMLELWAYQNLYYRGGPDPDRRRQRLDAGRRQPRRRHDDQLDQLPAHDALGARAVGAGVRARGGRRPRVRPPPRRGDGADRRQRGLQRLQRPDAADEGGRRAARLVLRARDPQRRPRHLHAGDGRLHRLRRPDAAPSRAPPRPSCATRSRPAARSSPAPTAQRVLVEDGRAAGVEAPYADPESGRTAAVTVSAPQVVVACGSLESPALLLRSGIGGPAVGQNLRLHPARRCSASTTRTSAPGGARPTPASSTSSPTPATATAS